MELAKIACTAHDKNKAIFDVEFLMEEAKCKSLDVVKLGLLDIVEMKDGLWNIKLYSFRHLTFQEFLTALFLADKISKKPDELEKTLKDLCKDTHSHVVLQFLAGLLKKEHHCVFFSHLNQWLHHPHRDDHSVDDNDGVDENRGDGRYLGDNDDGNDDSGDDDDNGAGYSDDGCHVDENRSDGNGDNDGLEGGSSDDHLGGGDIDGDDNHDNGSDNDDNSDEEGNGGDGDDNDDDNDDDDDDDDNNGNHDNDDDSDDHDNDNDSDDHDNDDSDDHDNDDDSDDRDGEQERLRVCLLCAQEACGGDVDAFPDQLKLPERVVLEHVTATDLNILTAAIQNSSTIERLTLHFDWVREDSDSASVSRVKRQTRSAMTSLTTAVSKHTSLRRVAVYGPTYSLFESKSLANLVLNNRLDTLRVWGCGIGDTEVSEFSSELQHTTLTWLHLSFNMISDAGMYALADGLQHNRTVQWLYLYDNRQSGEAAARLRQQLAHIKYIRV